MDNNLNPRQTGVSFGSGGPLLGAPASQVLAQPGSMQQTPSSPSFQAGLIPPQVQRMNPYPGGPGIPSNYGNPGWAQSVNKAFTMPTLPQAVQQSQQQGTVGMPPGNPETQMILKALASRLASLTKGEELQRGQ